FRSTRALRGPSRFLCPFSASVWDAIGCTRLPISVSPCRFSSCSPRCSLCCLALHRQARSAPLLLAVLCSLASSCLAVPCPAPPALPCLPNFPLQLGHIRLLHPS